MDPIIVKEIKDALDDAQVCAALYQGKKAVLAEVQEVAAKKKASALAVMARQNESAKRVHDAAVARVKDAYDETVNKAQDAFNAATAEDAVIVAATQEEAERAENELQTAHRRLKEKWGIDVGTAALGGSTRL